MQSEAQHLRERITPGCAVHRLAANTWRLSIPAGPGDAYRLAQLDDYSDLPRRRFPYDMPLTFSVQARASASELPGTWGLGLWNDPFSLSLGFGGGSRRFPVLPNAAWFFFASPSNYLSLRDDLPANGALAAVFRAANPLGLVLAGLSVPALIFRPLRKLARRLARRFVLEDAGRLDLDVTAWHTYRLDWRADRVTFSLDEQRVCQTSVSPQAPLGLVLWIDNQYAAFLPDGSLKYGLQENSNPAWIEIRDLQLATWAEESTPISHARVK